MSYQMFCYQCQETARGTGCTSAGVCGKTPAAAAAQDLLIFAVRGLSAAAEAVRSLKQPVPESVNRLVCESLFMTITNANFDRQVLLEQVRKALAAKRELLAAHPGLTLPQEALGDCRDGELGSVQAPAGVMQEQDEDIRSLKELITYGVKGMAAYAFHAAALGKSSEALHRFMQRALALTLRRDLSADFFTSLALETGNQAVQVMALLDEANTSAYGDPEITSVDLGVRDRPGILISGHDLHDLELLLVQTEGSGVDVYTHSEMLPAHGYPFFKKFPQLAGNYGGAWWRQKSDFENFRGPVLLTSNCLVPPGKEVMGRLWTTGAAGFPGCRHIDAAPDGSKDFSPLIEQALSCPPPLELERGSVVTGFGRRQLDRLAEAVAEALKSGKVRKFVVMAGCDGRSPLRRYYRDFALALPGDTVILTAGCAKYRYCKLPLGSIGSIPRVIDAGQCNDSYSLAAIAMKLQQLFGMKDINDLPIVYNIAWYEQKAVTVLLALLALGVKNIRLGPTLPAFLSPNTARLLIERFGLKTIGTIEEDMKEVF